ADDISGSRCGACRVAIAAGRRQKCAKVMPPIQTTTAARCRNSQRSRIGYPASVLDRAAVDGSPGTMPFEIRGQQVPTPGVRIGEDALQRMLDLGMQIAART